MPTHQGRLVPEHLLGEVKAVAKVGLRPSRVLPVVSRLPMLVELALGCESGQSRWQEALAVFELVSKAVCLLGDGPYGQAAGSLFGVAPATSGLPLGRRRAQAAEDIGAETAATFIRHWEHLIIIDVSMEIFGEHLRKSGAEQAEELRK